MLRTAKPKLSLSISTASQASTRPSLSLSTAIPRTPVSPSPLSPTAINTRMNKRGYATTATYHYQQQPTYAYSNSSSSKSILKKGSAGAARSSKRCQFTHEPTVYCVTPIENKEDYWVKIASREERRWGRQ